MDPFIGKKVDGYTVLRLVPNGEGNIGKVYIASRDDNIDNRAVKFIEKNKLRRGWENEIRKVLKLRRIPSVVQYFNHDWITVAGSRYLYIIWDYIPGDSIKKLIAQKKITIPLLEEIINQVLSVLHACRETNQQHGDLHTGNILVEKEDRRRLGGHYQPIWVTDFGYKASIGSGTLDDFKGLNRIVQECLGSIEFHLLEGGEKRVFSALKNEFPKYLLETNPTEGEYVCNPELLIDKFHELVEEKEESAIPQKRNINDYLAAELIGDRFDEWKDLFVPRFFRISDLLGYNISVLTGLRGCGKTTIFKRLTARFDLHLGSSGLPEAETFLGFYLSARYLAEAFPWLPEEKKDDARSQVVHYFHVSWSIEVISWLKEYAKGSPDVKFDWIIDFFKKYFDDLLVVPSKNISPLDFVLNFLIRNRDNSRLMSEYKKGSWPLSDYVYLEKFLGIVREKFPKISNKKFFMFLDDYSTPMVPRTMQEILNPIIFRRSSILVFKISTENVESFVPIGLHGKFLEEDNDYILIDFGTESIFQRSEDKKAILSAILEPRILRNEQLARISSELGKILGTGEFTNTELAKQIRREKDNSRIIYSGYNVFIYLWTGSVREMIMIFAEMIDKTNIDELDANFNQEKGLVEPSTQNQVLRTAGGNFLQLLSSATPPLMPDYEANEYERSFGDHIVKIARAFHQIALYDLKTKTSKNQQMNPPKQARRIEIKEVKDFPNAKVREYYKGIVRYGLFIRDNRGKSIRGKAVPRLILRGLLVPHFTLTFSRRDSIILSWENFCDLLGAPDSFAEKYIKGKIADDKQMTLGFSL